MSLLLLHKISVWVLLLIYLIKTILLLLNKRDGLSSFTKIVKVPEMIVSAGFLVTGIWMAVEIGSLNNYQIIKIIAVVLSIPLAVIGFRKSNKLLAVLSLLLLLMAYGLAEMSKKRGAHVDDAVMAANPGKGNYEKHCVSCHGADGKQMTMGATDLSASVLDRAGLIAVIANGKAGTSMAAYNNTLDSLQIEQVAEYVEGLRK